MSETEQDHQARDDRRNATSTNPFPRSERSENRNFTGFFFLI